MHLHVLPEGGGVGVRFVAACHATVVRFVGGVYVGVLLAVRGVGEPSITAFVFAFKWFLAWNNKKCVSFVQRYLLEFDWSQTHGVRV